MLRRRSPRCLHGSGLAAAQNKLKMISEGVAGNSGVPVKMGYQAIARVLVGDAVKNGVKGQQRIPRKIHLRDQAREQSRAKKRKVNVRRAPGIGMILPRVSAGL